MEDRNFKLIKAIRLNLEILGEKVQKAPIVHFHKFNFDDMLNWVYRNCKGCLEIKIIPGIRIEVSFEDRIEIYTIEEVEIPDYYVGEQ